MRNGPGSSQASAASTARSAKSSFGFELRRRSTATSWRKHQKLGVLRSRRTRPQRPCTRSGEPRSGKASVGKKPAMLPDARPTQPANPQVSNQCPVLEPTGVLAHRGTIRPDRPDPAGHRPSSRAVLILRRERRRPPHRMTAAFGGLSGSGIGQG